MAFAHGSVGRSDNVFPAAEAAAIRLTWGGEACLGKRDNGRAESTLPLLGARRAENVHRPERFRQAAHPDSTREYQFQSKKLKY